MPENYTNRLIHESSPYLLQHAHNPVDWHPWNEDTLAKARSMDRMLLVSIGYAACHWCHVMEKESFMDPQVAEIMNRYFICIKVDREERPDVDQVYMTAVQLIAGSGGWPLNCFALPDGRPFFGGTYFRKNQWLQLLENVHMLYENRRKDLVEQAETLARGVAESDLFPSPKEKYLPKKEDIEQILASLAMRFDRKEGGMSGSPKFPMPTILTFLLNGYYYQRDEGIGDFLKTTFTKMAYGGIYDQLGGGFARYSTDSQWKVPHFEKMLYDNAQLVSAYSQAWSFWKTPLFKETVHETLAFITREMTHPEGGFYSSLDADSEGSEGKYYTWGTGEFKKAAGAGGDLVARFYQLDGKGLWEDGRNILLRIQSIEEFAQGVGLQPSQFRTVLKPVKSRLLKYRQKRVRPGLDDKVLTSWNALMMKGFIDAYRAFDQPAFLQTALKNAGFLLQEMMGNNGKLLHSWKNGKAGINGFLEDYAYLAATLTELYQVTFERHYLDKALLLTEYAIQHFYDPSNGMFFLTSSQDAPLFARKQEMFDNVMPASNSCMARVLQLLGLAFERDDLSEMARRMVTTIRPQVARYPAAMTNWASVMLGHAYPFHSIAITGTECLEKAARIRKRFYPNLFLCGSEAESDLPLLQNRYIEGETMIFLCTGRECRLPTASVEEVLRNI